MKRSNLLYLESADNYVCIWYLNKGQLTKFMLRNSLKAIEESLADTNVLRCHRSFMVNFDQVKVIRREKEGVYLELGIEKVPDIPISKTYSEKVTRWFQTYSSSGLFQFDIIFFCVLRGAHVELLGEGPAEIGLRVETNRLGDLVNPHIALKD